jgi:hypothetical protein
VPCDRAKRGNGAAYGPALETDIDLSGRRPLPRLRLISLNAALSVPDSYRSHLVTDITSRV